MAAAAQGAEGDALRLWVFSDAHVGTDKKRGERESLADAIRQAESGAFEWDLALDLGDQSGGQAVPEDDEGQEVVRQFGALRKHRREDVYSVCGNHDRSGLDQVKNEWWRKWVDPTGENSRHSGVHANRRRYAVEGTWERYSFQVGNVLFLMMSDINEPSQKVGRGTLGGNPGGVVTGETFEWWKKKVETNQDKIIISAHHYMLKNTTVASGEWEGMQKDEQGNWKSRYHGYYPQGSPKGASYLYWVDSKPDAQAFERYLEAHPGAIALWLGGHTHTHPEDRTGNKSHFETKWGVHFLNASALTAHHGSNSLPMSRVLTLRGDELRVQCYLHTDKFAPQGWYPRAERRVKLRRRFQ
ncbi:MAG: metallophosphoesterase [Acidobacteria bacterium]|nr:metallophosphoesterase [Acidobacteriota bacterium]